MIPASRNGESIYSLDEAQAVKLKLLKFAENIDALRYLFSPYVCVCIYVYNKVCDKLLKKDFFLTIIFEITLKNTNYVDVEFLKTRLKLYFNHSIVPK